VIYVTTFYSITAPGDCTAVYKEDVAIAIAAGEEFGLPNSFLQISDANVQTKD